MPHSETLELNGPNRPLSIVKPRNLEIKRTTTTYGQY